MPGVRLHHPTFASCTYVVELPNRWAAKGSDTRANRPCNECQRPHARKALHLRLDNSGSVIVSRSVYETLRQVPQMAGLDVTNEVASPPPLALGAVESPTHLVVEQPLNADHRRPDIYIPGQNRYQGRDRIYAPFQPVIDGWLEQHDRAETKAKANKRSIFALGRSK